MSSHTLKEKENVSNLEESNNRFEEGVEFIHEELYLQVEKNSIM